MVNQNKIFSLKIKRQAKNVFPSDVERTVASFGLLSLINEPTIYFSKPVSGDLIMKTCLYNVDPL